MSKGFQFVQYDINEPYADESMKRMPYSPPVSTAKFGVYAMYSLIIGFIFMSLFLM